jgi:putative two-component system response regulator
MEAVDDEEKGLEMGAVDYLTKPINSAILMARVKTHLTLKQANDFLHDKNKYLEAEIDRRMEDNQIIQNVSIGALANLAETRDSETGEHILRTQAYVGVLAKRLQGHPRFRDTITNQFIELATRSAPLHDIGKVGIPDNILLKPDKLTDDEWVIMKMHAEIGAQAIEHAEKDVERPVEFLALAKEIAHWHHEKWDGSGYPDGLSGDEIPVSARLMALADVFDALTTVRVYKPAMPYEKARDIIVEGRGKHFDPDVTDAFLHHFDEFVEIANKHKG